MCSMHSRRNNLRESVGTRRDDGETGRDRLQAGVRKRIVNRRKCKDVGSGVERGEVLNYAQKFRSGRPEFPGVSPPGDQQKRIPPDHFDCLDSESQALSLPTCPHKESTEDVLWDLQAVTCFRSGNSGNRITDTVWNNADPRRREIVPMNNFLRHHL